MARRCGSPRRSQPSAEANATRTRGAIRGRRLTRAPGRVGVGEQGQQGSVASVAFTADYRQVVSGSEDKSVRVWDLASGECLATLEVRDTAASLCRSGTHCVRRRGS